jgi:flagellar biosynthetic protein FliQ
MTLVFVPKIIAIFITMLIALPFMGSVMSDFMMRISDMIVAGG